MSLLCLGILDFIRNSNKILIRNSNKIFQDKIRIRFLFEFLEIQFANSNKILFEKKGLVRRIIDFCEGDMEGASPLLSTGSLNF